MSEFCSEHSKIADKLDTLVGTVGRIEDKLDSVRARPSWATTTVIAALTALCSALMIASLSK